MRQLDEMYEELQACLDEINAAMEAVEVSARDQHGLRISKYALRDTTGAYTLIPLITEKARILVAIEDVRWQLSEIKKIADEEKLKDPITKFDEFYESLDDNERYHLRNSLRETFRNSRELPRLQPMRPTWPRVRTIDFDR